MVFLLRGPWQEMGFIICDFFFFFFSTVSKGSWFDQVTSQALIFFEINSLISRRGMKGWRMKIPPCRKKKNQRKKEEWRISVAKVLLKHFVQRHFQEHYSWLNTRFFFFSFFSLLLYLWPINIGSLS